MGAGLLAGLGRGIAAAGDIYGRGIMQQAMKREEDERQEARELAREGRADEREIAREKRKTEAEEARAEGLKQRVIKDTQAVQTRAGEIASERNATAFDKLAESSQQAGADGDIPLSKEQLQSLVKQNPELGKQYREMGLINSDHALTPQEAKIQRAQDAADAALQVGAHSSVIDAFSKRREAVLAEIKQENADKYAEARLDQADRKNAETERNNREETRIAAQRVEALVRGNAGGSGGSSGKSAAEIKAMTSMDIERAITASKDKMAFMLNTDVKGLTATISRLEQKAARGDKAAEAKLAEVKPTLTTFYQLSDRQMDLNRNAPESAAKPPVNTENKLKPGTRPPLATFMKN